MCFVGIRGQLRPRLDCGLLQSDQDLRCSLTELSDTVDSVSTEKQKLALKLPITTIVVCLVICL